jgi:acetylornithine deacetylase
MLFASDLRRCLAALVSHDTQNPTGDEQPLAQALGRELGALGAASVEVFAEKGHHSVYARFGEGTPALLVNAHLDTVPANAGYTGPPLDAVERDGRIQGLGTADTKGAIAAILAALSIRAGERRLPRGVGVLFSGDEESTSHCLRGFLASERARGLRRAIVCEPTGLRVGHRHRGVGAAEVTARGPGGHSSRADVLANPVISLARTALALDQWGKSWRELGPPGFRGLCLNVAGIEGGLAFNIVPGRATLRLSLRPGPGIDVAAVLAEAEGEVRRAAAPEDVEWLTTHANPAFSTRDLTAFEPLLGSRVEAPVDLSFWTEGALMAGAGIDAVVFGPGRIEQAHGADEYVEVAQLEAARDAFVRVFST